MDVSEDSMEMDTPSEMIDAAGTATGKSLPQKSRNQYERAYNIFLEWRSKSKKQTGSFSEKILLAYFQELSAKMKPSSLLSLYSMLGTTINAKHNINVSKYPKLSAFLKRITNGYKPKKSKTLTPQQIKEFLSAAPDEHFLFTKVGLIFGIMGACRREELWRIETNHVEDINTALLVHIPDTKTKIERMFVIGDSFYDICKKYMKLRPPNMENNRFFLTYQLGRCTNQPVGINKFGNIASQIATFLNLPNPTSYTGHCLRQYSASILVDSCADITALNCHGESQSTDVNTETETVEEIGEAVQDSCTTDTENFDIKQINFKNENATNINITYGASSSDAKNTHFVEQRLISFSNCQNVSNITVNLYLPK